MIAAERLSDLISGIYDCVLEETHWPGVLGELSAFVGGGSALLFHQNRDRRGGDFLQSYNADPEWTRRYFEEYMQINPVLPFTIFMEVGSCAALSTYIDLEEFRRSRFYLEWARPQNFLDVVVAVLEKSSNSMGMFGVTRFEHDGPAGAAAIERMKLVAPHIRRAVTLSRLFASLQSRESSFLQAVDSLPEPVFLLDADCRPVFSNAAARGLVEVGAILALRQDRLVLADAEGQKRLVRAVRASAAGTVEPSAQADFHLDAGDESRFACHLLPLVDDRHRAIGGGDALCALFLRPVTPDRALPMQDFAERFGFTPREFQVFMGIVRFGGVPAVARMYGIAPTTVRTHLKNIFSKTGTRRQADLARLAAGLA